MVQIGGEKRRGIGVAALFHGTSLGAEGADYTASTIEIQDDYSITLTSGLTDYGTGSRTVYTLIAAELLGVEPERIKMLRPDTNTALESGPTVASRSTMLGGSAVQTAARNLAKLLNMAAADLLRCDESRLIRVDEKFIGPTEEPVLCRSGAKRCLSRSTEPNSTTAWPRPPRSSADPRDRSGWSGTSRDGSWDT